MPDSARNSAQRPATWTKVAQLSRLQEKGKLVVRPQDPQHPEHKTKQIVIFKTDKGLFACNNRCPHEGYPLSEGSIDADCRLTCNWHNWKFQLQDGANCYDGEALRVYPLKVEGDDILLDLTDPSKDDREGQILASLRDAYDDNDFERMARELARLEVLGSDPRKGLIAAISWSAPKMQYGMTHAYAAAADWMDLHDRFPAGVPERLSAILECVAHMADDTLREPDYPFTDQHLDWDEEVFLAAVAAQDEERAIAYINGAIGAGLGYPDLEPTLARAALAYYQDFGHSAIYTLKIGELIARLGDQVLAPLTRSLVRGFCYAFREDLIPEFRTYRPALADWGKEASGERPDPAVFRKLNVPRGLETLRGHSGADPQALYQVMLAVNAEHLLRYDLAWQAKTDGKIDDNIGWLDFTHGITFANAVRELCTRYPTLWPQGLLQAMCFAGRNAAYTDEDLDISAYRVDDPQAFEAAVIEKLFDHAQEEFIVSAHLVKLSLASFREAALADQKTAGLVLAALNRFLDAPLKRKHLRRAVQQARDFVKLDG